MNRSNTARLLTWLDTSPRRPLVLRGARQVGKTWLVRDLASRSGRRLVELNLERDPSWATAFSSNRAADVLAELSLRIGPPIDPAQSLLFIDEIQARPELLAKLRWFYEDLPGLPVVAAGSLLEFTLSDHAMSMPVGRVTFEHVEPMGFAEYLLAHDQAGLLDRLGAWQPGAALSPTAHQQATTWFHRYAMVGGMPAVVAADVAGQSPAECRRTQADLMATYRADFARYRGRMDVEVLDAVLAVIARSLGQKFVYARVGEGIRQPSAKAALERLARARLCHLVTHTAANGLPLAAEADPRHRKAVLGDVGLVHAMLRTPAADAFPAWASLGDQLRGQLAEQLTAQQLRLTQASWGDGPELHMWRRGGGRPGGIDFVVPLHGHVVPIEVKAGAAGGMKSLHQFMFDKGLHHAVRCDANPPSVQVLDVKTNQGQPVRYAVVNCPHYLVWNLERIVEDWIAARD